MVADPEKGVVHTDMIQHDLYSVVPRLEEALVSPEYAEPTDDSNGVLSYLPAMR